MNVLVDFKQTVAFIVAVFKLLIQLSKAKQFDKVGELLADVETILQPFEVAMASITPPTGAKPFPKNLFNQLKWLWDNQMIILFLTHGLDGVLREFRAQANVVAAKWNIVYK